MSTPPYTEQILSVYQGEDIFLSSSDKTDDPGSCLACSLVEEKEKENNDIYRYTYIYKIINSGTVRMIIGSAYTLTFTVF